MSCTSSVRASPALLWPRGISFSSLTMWVRQVRINHYLFYTHDQGQHTSEESAELTQLLKENRELLRKSPVSIKSMGGVNQVDRKKRFN